MSARPPAKRGRGGRGGDGGGDGSGARGDVDVGKVKTIHVNTGNGGKWRQLERIFAALEKQDAQQRKFVLVRHSKDLDEIDGTPMETAVHKATTAGQSLVTEDTSLLVEGADFKPTHIRWNMHKLAGLTGRRAMLNSHVAVRFGGNVMVYVAIVKGHIGKRHKGSGQWDGQLEEYFVPDGLLAPLSALSVETHSARYLAYAKFITGTGFKLHPTIASKDWTGPWQPRDGHGKDENDDGDENDGDDENDAGDGDDIQPIAEAAEDADLAATLARAASLDKAEATARAKYRVAAAAVTAAEAAAAAAADVVTLAHGAPLEVRREGVVKRLTAAFKPLGVIAFTDCCRADDYSDHADYKFSRGEGIRFFGLCLRKDTPVRRVRCYYGSCTYLKAHKTEQEQLVRSWCDAVGATLKRVILPEFENEDVEIVLARPLVIVP